MPICCMTNLRRKLMGINRWVLLCMLYIVSHKVYNVKYSLNMFVTDKLTVILNDTLNMEHMKNRMKCLRLMLRQQHPPATSLLKYTNHYNIVITRTCM